MKEDLKSCSSIKCPHYESIDKPYAYYRKCKLNNFYMEKDEGMLVVPEWCLLGLGNTNE